MNAYKPLQEKAYEYLKEMISSGKMESNVIYSETKMAAEIGVSRTPMKDALVRLNQDKYIDIIPSKGFCLHVMSEDDVWSTYQVRMAIEGFCAVNLQMERHTERGRLILRRLSKSMENMEAAINNGSENREILTYDLAFHHELVFFSGNPELIRLFESYNHRLYDIAIKSMEEPGRAKRALEEHRQIYANIISDEEFAPHRLYSAVMNHMTTSRDITLNSYHRISSTTIV